MKNDINAPFSPGGVSIIFSFSTVFLSDLFTCLYSPIYDAWPVTCNFYSCGPSHSQLLLHNSQNYCAPITSEVLQEHCAVLVSDLLINAKHESAANWNSEGKPASKLLCFIESFSWERCSTTTSSAYEKQILQEQILGSNTSPLVISSVGINSLRCLHLLFCLNTHRNYLLILIKTVLRSCCVYILLY